MKFKETVYAITRNIPPGKVATYGQIARLAGFPKAARAVGMYMRTNPFAPQVPCHRVVGVGGRLTGFSGKGGINGKKAMLVREGVVFSGDKVNLAVSQWGGYNGKGV